MFSTNISENLKMIITFNDKNIKNVHGHIKFNNGYGSSYAPYKINSTYSAKVQSF